MIHLTKLYNIYYAWRPFCSVKSTNFVSLKPIFSHLAWNTRDLNNLRANCLFKVLFLLTVFGRTPYFSQRPTARVRTFLFPAKEVRMFGTLKLKAEEIYFYFCISLAHILLSTQLCSLLFTRLEFALDLNALALEIYYFV